MQNYNRYLYPNYFFVLFCSSSYDKQQKLRQMQETMPESVAKATIDALESALLC
jgi:hypothetical protein